MQNNLLSKTLSNGYLITPSSGLSVKGWHIFFTYKKVTLQFCLHFIWVRKLDSDSITEMKNWKRQKWSYWDLWQATPFMTTKQTTPYAVNYRLNACWTR